MANVLNRTTKVYLESVNTPDYPDTDWIINPDLSAVAGWPAKYWIITGDVVTLMDASARATVDADELAAQRDALVAQMDQVESYTRAFALVVLDEINNLRALHSLADRTIAQLKNSVRNKLGS